MKILILARTTVAAPLKAQKWSEQLSRSSGIPCGSRSVELEGNSKKIPRATFVAAFHGICDTIEGLIESDAEFSRSRIVLLQSGVAPPGIPLLQTLVATDYSLWANLVAVLILVFPDVLWVFSTTAKEHKAFTAAGLEVHSLGPRHTPEDIRELSHLRNIGFDPLFDPTGLRDLVKRQSFESIKNLLQVLDGVVQCPARHNLAVTIDDECEVAAALSYIHYRQGYRVSTITSQALLEHAAMLAPVSRTAESFTVVFPDSSLGREFGTPSQRSESIPFLGRMSKYHRLVYTIDERTENAGGAGTSFSLLSSPFDGIAGLCKSFRLDHRPERFVWPPAQAERGHTPGRHAVPGFMTTAARRLMGRVQRAAEPHHVKCMFALEAQELLLNRLPSLSLIAHRERLIHELRLENEIPTLLGGGGAEKLELRFVEIDDEVNSMLAVIYSRSGARRADLAKTFRMQLVGTMIDELREGYHFREEVQSIAQQRSIDLGSTWFGAYLALILSNSKTFVGFVTGLMLAFAFIYWIEDATCGSIARAITLSVYTFVSVGEASGELRGSCASSLWYSVTMTIEAAIGLIHWAIGLANIYTLLSRR